MDERQRSSRESRSATTQGETTPTQARSSQHRQLALPESSSPLRSGFDSWGGSSSRTLPAPRHPYVRAASYEPPSDTASSSRLERSTSVASDSMSTSDQNRSGGRRGSAIIDFGEPLPGQDQETGRWGESASFSTTSIALPEVRLDGLGASTLASGSSTIGRADRRPRPPALPQSGMAGDRWPDAGQPTARPPGVPSVVRQSEDADEEAFSDASHEEVGASHPLLGLSPSGPASGSMSRSGSLTGSFGAGGYASSVDGEYTSAPPSRLTSRAATPSPGPAGQYAESAADIETGTESDATTSDYYERPLKGAQGGLGGAKGVASILGLPSGWQKDSSLRNGGWGVASGASPPLTPATVSKARNTKKSWNKMRSQDRDVPLRPFHWSSSSKNRRKTSRGLIAPLRMLSSLLCKLFRTFFGPIHPLTIMIALVLIASFVVSVTMLIIYILNPDKEPLPWRSYCQQQLPFPHPYADALAPVDVFVGVFSVDNAYERRHLIRNTYAAHTLPLDPRTGMPTSNVQVKFVIGRPRKAHARRVALEMEMFNDLVVLDIPENMNQGKTHAFFKWAADNATVPILHPKFEPHAAAATDLSDYAATAGPARVALSGPGEAEHSGQGPASNLTSMKGKPAYEVGWKKADYVVKADDDAFIILDELERHLRVAPRHMTYWGYLIRNWFMGGECYALSADLVRYVATSTAILPHVRGKEDKKVAQWMNLHPNRTSINWVSEHCWVYDHPKAGTAYSHGFLFPDYVEKIKTEARRGLSDQEIARRGGEHRAKSYSSVSKWRQAYIPPRDDLTMEEEVEALIEGGGRWSGTWVRGEEGNDTWVPWEEIVFEANDERLRPVGPLGQGALAADVGLEPSSGLPVYGAAHPGVENSAPQSQKLRDREEQPSDISAEVLVQRDPGWLDQGPEDDSGFLPNLQGFPNIAQLHRQHEQLRSSHGLRAPPPRLIPHPTNKDSGDEAAALRARRYLGRPHGGTVVVHFLKKSEWFLETAVAFLGRQKTWVDGAGGVGSEWRMFGSPLLRHDNYVSEGRSQPRPEPNVAPDVRIPDASSSGTSQTASRASKTSTSGTRSSSSVETSSSPNRAEESSTVPPPKTTTASGTNHRTGHHV